MVHEPGAEPDRVPLAQIGVDARGILAEVSLAAVKLAVMAKIVNSHLETAPPEVLAQFDRRGITAFGNEIKAGAEAMFFLEARQVGRFRETPSPLDIVGEHQRKALSFRPACPALRLRRGRGVDRPDVPGALQNPAGKHAPKKHSKLPRDIGLEVVIKISEKAQSCVPAGRTARNGSGSGRLNILVE